MNKIKILISNDDGYGAPGVLALKEVLANHYNIWYALPDRDRSGSSQSLTLHRPIKVSRMDNFGIVVEGTPADCVRLSLSGLCEFEPDFVVAGINAGANLGTDVLYSGTVAAAMEGLCAGIPAVAFSLTGSRFFETAAFWSLRILSYLTNVTVPKDILFNVNIPDIPISHVKGVRITNLGRRDFSRNLLKTSDPRSNERYWIGLPGEPLSYDENSDFQAVCDGYVSISCLVLGRYFSEDLESLFSDLIQEF